MTVTNRNVVVERFRKCNQGWLILLSSLFVEALMLYRNHRMLLQISSRCPGTQRSWGSCGPQRS